MSIRTPGDGEPPVSGSEGIGEEAARALQTELLGYIDTSITKLILAQMAASPMGKLPQELQRKYAAALAYARQKNSKWPTSFVDCTTEEIASLLQVHELSFFDWTGKIGLISDETVLPNFSVDPKVPDLPHEMAGHRAVEEGVKLEGLKIEEWEYMLAKDLKPEDLVTLLKVGQEGPLEYAPLVSKLQHFLDYPGVRPGEETAEAQSQGKEEFGQCSTDFLGTGTLSQKRLLLRYDDTFISSQRSASLPLMSTCISALRSYTGGDVLQDWPRIYEQLLPHLGKQIGVFFIGRYFIRDREQITEQTLAELRQMICTVAAFRYNDLVLSRDASSHKDEEGRLVSQAGLTIAAVLGKEVEEEVDKRLRLLMQQEYLGIKPEGYNDIAGLQWYFERRLDIFSKFPGSERSFREHNLMEVLVEQDKLGHLFGGSSSLREYALNWYGEFLTLPLKELRGADRKVAAAKLDRLVDSTTDPKQWSDCATRLLIGASDKTGTQALLQKVFEKLALVPEHTFALVKELSYVKKEEQTEIRTNFEFFQRFFSHGRLERHPALAQSFFKLLAEPDYQTFYNACSIACAVLEHENFQGSFSEQFFGRLFASEADFTDPLRLTILRNISERLGDVQVAPFFQRIIALPMFPTDPEAREKIFSLVGGDRDVLRGALRQQEVQTAKAQDKVARKIEQEKRTKGPIQFLQNIVSDQFPPHDLQALIQEIREHRTIHISHDGHEEGLQDVPSPLALAFHKARIKRNKETGNPPDGLACNVTIYTKTDVALACRVNVDGSLAIRLLDEHGSETGKTITRSTAAQYQVPEAVFDELHFVVLKCLEKIYVRKEKPVPAEQPAEVTPPVAALPVVATGGEEPTPPPVVELINGLPKVTKREDKPMRMDLTDSERLQQRRLRIRERKLIETNLATTERVFAPLTRGEGLETVVPPETAGLMLHTCLLIDGQPFFQPVADPVKLYQDIRSGKIKPDEVFVRHGRAHVKFLPFMETLRHARTDTGSYPVWAVHQDRRSTFANLKYDTFLRDERGEAMDLANSPKILYFDVEDSPDNPIRRKLFDRMKSGQNIPDQLRTKERELEKRMRTTREALRQQFLAGDQPDLLTYLAQKLRAEKEALREYEEYKKILEEMSRKTREVVEAIRDPNSPNGVGTIRKLGLPQAGFVLEKTFNQGGFKTLAEVLRLPSVAEGAPSQL